MRTMIPVVLTIGLASGLFSGFVAAWLWQYERHLMSLPTAPGLIVASYIRRTVANFEQPSQVIAGKERRLELYVRYTYTISGKHYTGTRLSNGSQFQIIHEIGNTQPSRGLNDLARRFALGAIVPVHYDPANPAKSWLYIDRAGSNLFATIAIVSFVISFVAIGLRKIL